jgi:hypothetical protein
MDHFKNAIRKCQHFSGRKWVGYLIGMEILALVEKGAIYQDNNQCVYYVEQAKLGKKHGIATSGWFYFETPRSWNLSTNTLDDLYT